MKCHLLARGTEIQAQLDLWPEVTIILVSPFHPQPPLASVRPVLPAWKQGAPAALGCHPDLSADQTEKGLLFLLSFKG